jgi:putative hydrolase of the HAD superfamily
MPPGESAPIGMPGLTDGIAAVVFDFYGTLTPVSPADIWTEHISRLAAAFGVAPQDLTRVLDETYPERFIGALGDARQTLRALAGRLGVQVSDQQLDEAARLRQEIQESGFRLRPEALPVIGQLRERGLRTGLVSDCTSELPEAWPRLPVSALIDAPVFSCVEGMRKPDPRLFRTVAARLGADPAACLYVGDGGGRELTGSTAVGMRAVLLAGPDWHSNRVYDREKGWDGLRIGSLTELAG